MVQCCYVPLTELAFDDTQQLSKTKDTNQHIAGKLGTSAAPSGVFNMSRETSAHVAAALKVITPVYHISLYIISVSPNVGQWSCAWFVFSLFAVHLFDMAQFHRPGVSRPHDFDQAFVDRRRTWKNSRSPS